MFFSRNIDNHWAQRIRDGFGFKITTDIGKYPRVSIIHGRTTRGTYSYLVDKLQRHSAFYHTTRLSFAGRTTLAKSVLSALPIYTM